MIVMRSWEASHMFSWLAWASSLRYDVPSLLKYIGIFDIISPECIQSQSDLIMHLGNTKAKYVSWFHASPCCICIIPVAILSRYWKSKCLNVWGGGLLSPRVRLLFSAFQVQGTDALWFHNYFGQIIYSAWYEYDWIWLITCTEVSYRQDCAMKSLLHLLRLNLNKHF